MEGEIIIRAMPEEQIQAAAASEGKEFNTGISFDVRIRNVTLGQRLAVVKDLGDALKFSKVEWALLMMEVANPGTFRKDSVEIKMPHRVDLRREGSDAGT